MIETLIMIKYPGANNPHFYCFYQLRVARGKPGHFTIYFFSIILSGALNVFANVGHPKQKINLADS